MIIMALLRVWLGMRVEAVETFAVDCICIEIRVFFPGLVVML